MKRKNAACYLMIFSLLFANAAQFGCGKDDKPAEPLEQSDVVFGSHTNGLISLAIDDYANVYATTLDVGISKYSREGMLLESYPDTEYIFGLRYSDGFLYGFYSSLVDNNYIYQLNLETLIVKTINVDFPIAVVHSFTVSGDYAYMVVIPTLMDFNYEHEAGMFASNNEKLYAVKLSSGETTEITNIENPIRLYADSKGTVYVYAYTGGQYQLLNYDIGKKKATRVANMDDVGPVVSFAYENDIFVFLTYRDVQAKRMEDSLIYTVGENFAAVYGNTFTYHKGNLVFVEQRMEKYEGVYLIDVEGCEDGPDHDLHDHGVLNPPYLYIRTMRLGSGFVSVAPIGVKDVNQHQPLSNADTVVVSITPLFRPFDTKLIYERSGINCVYSDQTNDTFEQISNFLLTVMAGDNNSDIFYLALEDAVSRAMRDNGGYVRLNESDVITGYLDRCFDWVGEAARAANGDVWMLPLLYQTEMLFYVPENMERFNIGYDDISTYKKLLATIDRLNPIKDGFTTFSNTTTLEGDLVRQYQRLFCDYANKKADFNTSEFRELYEAMWNGWNRLDHESITGENFHPILQYDDKRIIFQNANKYLAYNNIRESRNDAAEVIFKTEPLTSFLYTAGDDFAKWRAYHSPRLSIDTETKNDIRVLYLMINPKSENKELAIRFLEEIAADMLTVYNKPEFVLKDISEYEGHYDMDLPIYRDIHEIMKNGAPLYRTYPPSESYMLVDEYQSGRMSLDEVAAEIQRRVEIWLNE